MSDLITGGLPETAPTEGLGTDGFSASFAIHLPSNQVRISFPPGITPVITGSATVPSNYVITGALNPQVFAVTVLDKFIYLNVGTHTPGANYIVQLPSGIFDTLGNAAIPVTLGYVAVNVVLEQSPINGGAENDDAYQVLRKNFNPLYVNEKNWDALLWAVAYGDQLNWDNSTKVFAQLFPASASGTYLNTRGLDYGVRKPSHLGISDYNYRNLIIKNYSEKLTELAVNYLLQIFYGEDSVKGNVLSIAEPYALTDGDDLIIKLNNKDVYSIYFDADAFTSISSAKAIEVAAVITKQLQDVKAPGYAIAWTSPTGSTSVKIYSSELGLGSKVQVLGGRAQRVLKFPTELVLYSGSNPPTWVVSIQPNNRIRFTTSTSPTGLALSGLMEGDWVAIYGTEFNASNRGSFEVKAVSVIYPGPTQYFEIDNLYGVAETVPQTTNKSILYFRPLTGSIYSDNYFTYVSQNNPEIDVVLPVTSTIINRTEYSGSYWQPVTYQNITALTKINNGSITVTSAGHGLSAGDQIFIEGTYPTLTYPSVTPGGAGLTGYSYMTFVEQLTAGHPRTIEHQANLLSNNKVLLTGGFNTQTSAAVDNTTSFAITNTTNPVPGKIQHTYAWTSLAVLPAIRQSHSACNISESYPGAEVCVTGGRTTGGAPQSSVYVYSPDLNTWTTLNNMNQWRINHASVQLNNKKVFVCGGYTDLLSTVTNTCEIGDLILNSWTTVANMNTARAYHKILKLSSGKVLAIGGVKASVGPNDALNSCEIYDPDLDTWTFTGSMTWARYSPALVRVSDTQILAVAGWGKNPTQPGTTIQLSTIEMYDVNSGFWTPYGNLVYPLIDVTASFWPATNQVYITGYNSDGNHVIQVLDLATGNVTVLPISIARKAATGTVIPNKGILVYSGLDPGNLTADAGFLIVPNAEEISVGNLNDFATVATVPDANTFTIASSTPGYESLATGQFVKFKAGARAFAGPYIFDVKSGFTISGYKTTLNQNIGVGQQFNYLTVTDSTLIPNTEGYIVINYGYDNQVGPIKYYGRLLNNKLSIDFDYVFPTSLSSGVTVTYLLSNAPYTGTLNQMGALYLTDTPIGRVTAEKFIIESTAEGIDKNITVAYPGDRGLGAEGFGTTDENKASDIVDCYDTDREV